LGAEPPARLYGERLLRSTGKFACYARVGSTAAVAQHLSDALAVSLHLDAGLDREWLDQLPRTPEGRLETCFEKHVATLDVTSPDRDPDLTHSSYPTPSWTRTESRRINDLAQAWEVRVLSRAPRFLVVWHGPNREVCGQPVPDAGGIRQVPRGRHSEIVAVAATRPPGRPSRDVSQRLQDGLLTVSAHGELRTSSGSGEKSGSRQSSGCPC